MLRALTSVAIFSTAALGFLAGCASNKSACCDSSAAAKSEGSIAVVNTMCPIGGDDFETKQRPPELARTYKGTSIGFCCEGCVKSFDKMSDEKKADVTKAALANKTL